MSYQKSYRRVEPDGTKTWVHSDDAWMNEILSTLADFDGGGIEDDDGAATTILIGNLSPKFRNATRSAINARLRKLNRKGFIRRKTHGRRTLSISLSPKGWARVEGGGNGMKRRVECPECDREITSNNLKRHLRGSHGYTKAAAQRTFEGTRDEGVEMATFEPEEVEESGEPVQAIAMELLNLVLSKATEEVEAADTSKLEKEITRVTEERDKALNREKALERNLETLKERVEELDGEKKNAESEVRALSREMKKARDKGFSFKESMDPESRELLNNLLKRHTRQRGA